MSTAHLEVETKYDVDVTFELPALDGLDGVAGVDPPVEYVLEAVYHDTEDLRLLRARVTLRRRTGGADAGWHLKLPAGAARRELHEPLGRSVKPPRALLVPVAGILRGAPTSPVATLRTRRVVTSLRDDAGRMLAEVADDTVTATALARGAGAPAEVMTWREVEVELGDGDAALATAVGERLIAAGARVSASPSKVGRVLAGRPGRDSDARTGGTEDGAATVAGEFVLAALREQLAALQAADVLLRTEQPDALHQMRVSARRLRSTLAEFRAVLGRQAVIPLRGELAWLGGALAGARDDEVALAHLRDLVAAEPAELVLGPVAARLQQLQLREERAGLDRALQTVDEPRYLRLLDSLHALVAAPASGERAGEDLEPVLRDAVRRSARRLRRRMRTARRAPEGQRRDLLHDVRKAAKRARYVTEVAAAQLDDVRAVARTAEEIQRVLGELQDTVVTRELCRRCGVVAFAEGENAFTFGRLHALEQTRAERVEQQFWAFEAEVRPVLRKLARQRDS